MKTLSTLALAIALSGCGSYAAQQKEITDLAEARRQAPTCTAGADCNAKWDAAQIWIAKHAGFKLQTATSAVLQTFGPTQSIFNTAVTVTREPAGQDQYRIVANMACGSSTNICGPSLSTSLRSFNEAVSAAKP